MRQAPFDHFLEMPDTTLCPAKVDFEELEKIALSAPDPIEDLPSGSTELYEILLSGYIK